MAVQISGDAIVYIFGQKKLYLDNIGLVVVAGWPEYFFYLVVFIFF